MPSLQEMASVFFRTSKNFLLLSTHINTSLTPMISHISKDSNFKKAWITAYDFFSGRVAAENGVDGILVGDSLGMTVYGFKNTKSVTVDMMLAHACAVQKGVEQSLNPNTPIMVDFPFGTTSDMITALETAEIFASKGFTTFKIEGGKEHLSLFMELINRGYTVVGHLGLTPQTSDIRVYGKTEEESTSILESISAFEALGMRQIVLECVPAALGKKAQEQFSGDIIGIGAGNFPNAQILVFDDTVGRTVSDFSPKFLKRYGNAFEHESLSIQNYIDEVKRGVFPEEKHWY